MVQFYPRFKLYFRFFLGMLMNDNEFQTKKSKIKLKHNTFWLTFTCNMHAAISYCFTKITNMDRAKYLYMHKKCMGLYENLIELIPTIFPLYDHINFTLTLLSWLTCLLYFLSHLCKHGTNFIEINVQHSCTGVVFKNL